MATKPSIPGEQLADIANAMVRLKADYYGRGPSAAKAFVIDELLVCVMRGGITRVERTLLDADRSDLVREVRLRWQEAMADSFRGVIEEISGYRVATFESQVLFDPDYIIEIAVLGDPIETRAAN